MLAIPYFSIRLGFPDDSRTTAGKPSAYRLRPHRRRLRPGANGLFFPGGATAPYALDEDSLTNLIGDLAPPRGRPDSSTVDMVPISVTPTRQVGRSKSSHDQPAGSCYRTSCSNDCGTRPFPAAEQNTTMRAYVGGTTWSPRTSRQCFPGQSAGLPGSGRGTRIRRLDDPVPVVDRALIGAVTSLLSLGAALGSRWPYSSGAGGESDRGHRHRSILPFLPIMVFAILFGLSMDYQVFLVSRMHEEWSHTKDNALSVRRGLAGSGRVVAIAAAIMSSVFLAFIPTRRTPSNCSAWDLPPPCWWTHSSSD